MSDPRGADSRRLAAGVVERVIDEGAYVQHALGAALDSGELAPRDRAFATELVYGALTWRRPIDLALDRALERGLDSLAPNVRALLRIGAYQLHWRREEIPTFAAVHETVEAARQLIGRRKSGLVNGVLRTLDRDRENVFQPPTKHSEVQRLAHATSLPDWIAERLVERRTIEGARACADAWNAPTRVVVRWRDSTPPGEDDPVRAHPRVPGAYVLTSAVSDAPLLREGRAVVQDAGAQLAGWLVPDSAMASPDARVLDLCAGVGGKTRHLVDRFGASRVLAADISGRKLRKLARELPEVQAAAWDLARGKVPESLAAQLPADVVLLDAPCSGLGSIGRHPETRWNRDASIVAELAELQSVLLRRAGELVKPGGTLVYVVCTFTAEEGRDQVARFVAEQDAFEWATPSGPLASAAEARDAARDEAALDGDDAQRWDDLVDASGGVSLWPDLHDTDGFYLARLRRRP